MKFFDLDDYKSHLITESDEIEQHRRKQESLSGIMLEEFKKTIFIIDESFENDMSMVGRYFFSFCVYISSLSKEQFRLYHTYLFDNNARRAAKLMKHCVKLIDENHDFNADIYGDDYYWEWECFAYSKRRTIRKIVKEEFKDLLANDDAYDDMISLKSNSDLVRGVLMKKKTIDVKEEPPKGNKIATGAWVLDEVPL